MLLVKFTLTAWRSSGSNSGDTITPTSVSAGVTGNPPPGNFADLIFGFNSNDVINGGGGNDVIIGAHGNDTLNGGEGNDFFLYTGSNNGYDTVSGGDGSDTIVITSDNTVVGLNSFDNGIEFIDVLNTSGSRLTGTGGSEVLNFSNVAINNIGTGFEIDAAGGNEIGRNEYVANAGASSVFV